MVIEKIKRLRTDIFFENGLSQVQSICSSLFIAATYLVHRYLVYRSFVGDRVQVQSRFGVSEIFDVGNL